MSEKVASVRGFLGDVLQRDIQEKKELEREREERVSELKEFVRIVLESRQAGITAGVWKTVVIKTPVARMKFKENHIKVSRGTTAEDLSYDRVYNAIERGGSCVILDLLISALNDHSLIRVLR